MNISALTQAAKNNGYGKAFQRYNGEICITNRTGKVVFTFNPDLTVKFARVLIASEVETFKTALIGNTQNTKIEASSNNMVDSGAGFAMKDTARNRNIVDKYGFDAIEMID